ncbi:RsmB/NOP family class I SAM-dependent RNA methyltransferase [Candidatus Pacearchaeota archaeon]|nr:RsmB/NOP family class I SAM-dependent RNA methyltransferase [Candidatus Pacearchaeota archaeon]
MKEYFPKEKFIERIHLLLRDNEDVEKFFEIAKTQSKKAIRVNTLKISDEELKKRLEDKGWKISQPFKEHKEIMIVDNKLEPGMLGKSIEHLLGYYYVQEITSMMPIIALQPKADDSFLDLCAAPGSKTTQAAAIMNNKGTIIANDVSIGRISILIANLERIGVANTIVTRHEGEILCRKLQEQEFHFDKILIDAPCSGEGNIRCSPRTYLEWSEGLIKSLSKKQKRIVSNAIPILKKGGELVYSTCTYAPEENELIIQHLLDNFDLEIVNVKDKIPLIARPGILEWKGQKFHESMKKAVRIYHHDNDLEGFFLCKMRKR